VTSDLGYYKLGDHWYFINKTEAVQVASKYNRPLTWNFNNDVFGNINWSVRPAGTLADLYRERAQQIRDTYDYVVVHFSGGMDSWTVLHSFLANGIHVDEIFTRWAFAEKKYNPWDHTNTDEYNLGKEFDYAVVPVLEHVSKNYPKTKIVIDDYSQAFEQDLPEGALISHSTQYQTMPTFFRFNRQSESEKFAIEHGKSVGVVNGYEKIRCVVKNNNFYAYFSDSIGGINSTPARHIELFYWTRKFPQIPILQAHVIKDYVKNHKHLFLPDLDIKIKYRELYQQACYPEYNVETFQVDKPFGSLIWASDAWIKQYNKRFYDSWKWNIDQHFNSIDSRFLNKKTIDGMSTGMKTLQSPHYLIEANVNIGVNNIDWFDGVFHP